MADTPKIGCGDAERHMPRVSDDASSVEAWFARVVLPLEPALMQFLRHNWRNPSDIADLRQDVYERVFAAALKEIPAYPRQFVFTTARNLLINRVRDEQVVPFEAVTDIDALAAAMDMPGPDRTALAKDELRRVQSALDSLPTRCREVVIHRRIVGISRKEIAVRMGIAEDTVTEHFIKGMRRLASLLYSDPTDLGRML
jgi:RNA polymerase sigma-70 factor (ECF subfamily)